MQLSKQANERLWDALIKEALIQDCYNELAELEKTVKPHTFSERFEKNIAKMKRKVFGKERLKAAGVIIRNVAAVVMIVIGLTFGVLLTQPEVYAAVENVIKSVFDNHDEYEFSGSDLTLETFNSEMRFRYIPDGYYLSTGNYSPAYVKLIYTNEHEEIILEYAIAKGLSFSLDNEHNSYETLYINNIEYHYYESFDDDFYNS
ncbi:MAG: DUF4367 domain-containing protein, partial [Oscillospiraceae bacterium]|nr:DUF4367 domain-containing protein [Oscillospiraceae bacterium]